MAEPILYNLYIYLYIFVYFGISASHCSSISIQIQDKTFQYFAALFHMRSI